MNEQYTNFLMDMKVAELRKIASQEGVKGLPTGRKVSSGRKGELVAALVELHEDRAEQEAKAARAAKKAAKPAAKSDTCEVCFSAKINPATQGRDSSMCTACYAYAGWENTHSDWSHGPENIDTNCPVCARDGLLENDRSLAGKPERFAEDARSCGWKVVTGVIEQDGVDVSIVTARRNGETLRIFWDGKSCRNTGTTHTDADKDGKPRKVRNASAARKILASS